MRTKNFLLFITCVFASTVFLIIFGSQQSDSLQNIVTSTHQQLRHFQDNLRDAEQKNFVADEKYLKQLCFTSNPRLYPNATWHNTSLPVVVTYARDGQQSQVIGLIINISRVLINHTILVYDLGLSSSGLQTLINYCNSSHCQILNFDLSVFPTHVDKDRGHAYRPLVIQDALCRTGAILFLENNQRLAKHTTLLKILALYQRALYGSGILVWPMKYAVSSLTHPKMFDYFHTEPDSFYFVQMADIQRLFIINTAVIHKQIMLPWVQCALTIDCILPIGAQWAGCRYDKKPLYRYSGCHNYDLSALNIVLALTHANNESHYMFRNTINFFVKVSLDRAVTELVLLERNSSVSESSSSTSNLITSS